MDAKDALGPAKELAAYFFINTSLGMKAGKIAAQVAHASEMIAEEIFKISNEGIVSDQSMIRDYMKYLQDGRTKIVLKATAEQFEKLSKEPGATCVIDAGRTQIPPNSMTVIGFKPSPTNRERFNGYKLY